MYKKLFLTISALQLFVMALAQNYPYGNGSGCMSTCYADPWGFCKWNCTSYVAWKMNANNGVTSLTGSFAFFNTMTGSGTGNCSPTSGQLSHACRWNDLLALKGYYVSQTPTVGAIAHWEGNEIGNSYGHVEYVEAVNSNGSVETTAFNSNVSCGFSRQTRTSIPRYIRFSRIMMTGMNCGAQFIQGQSISFTASLKNNLGSAYSNVKVRAALYNSSNQFVGAIEEKSLAFAANETKSLTFSKSSLSSSPGDYKIWIETQWGNSPWVLVHKSGTTSTQPIRIAANVNIMSLSTTQLNFTNNASSKSVVITNSLPATSWYILNCPSWITLSPSFGTGTRNVVVTVQPNLSNTVRTITLNVMSNGTFNVMKPLIITQAASPTILTLSSYSIQNVIPQASMQSVSVNTNNPTFSAVSSTNWLNVSKNGNALMLSFQANPNSTYRSALITVTAGNVNKTINISQQAGYLTPSISQLTLSSTASTRPISISASALYTATSNVSWATVRVNGNTLTINVLANNTSSPRSGSISIRQGNITKVITITQLRRTNLMGDGNNNANTALQQQNNGVTEAAQEKEVAVKEVDTKPSMLLGEEATTTKKSQIYPNPIQVGDNLTLKFQSELDKEVLFEIVDLEGKVVLTLKQVCFKGENFIQLNTNMLSNGVHFIHNSLNKEVLKFEVIK